MRAFFILTIILIFGCTKSDSELDEKLSKELSVNFEYLEGLSSYNIQHGGLNREYLLYIPPNIESRTNLPVIFNFHGYQGQADDFFNWTNLVNIADENGVVLVYPQGALLPGGASHWNAAPGNSNLQSFINKSNVDDLGFFNLLLDEVNQNNIIDLKRIYAIGYSNGGMFSHFLACNTDKIFAAIGDVAGTMLSDTYDSCDPSSPTPLLKIHGTSDNVVAYDGFDQQGFKTVNEVVEFWKLNNNSNDSYIFNSMISSSWANYMGPVDFEKYTYESDLNGPSIVHYKMLSGGHWWNYSLDNDLKTSTLLWEFFSKHSRE